MNDLNPIAESYVKLVLAFGAHDADYVDAYYGPEEWKSQKKSLDDIKKEVLALRTELLRIDPANWEELFQLRHQYLVLQLGSLLARAEMIDGEWLSFDEESKALYNAVAPEFPAKHFQAILDQIDEALEGEGELLDRLNSFRDDFKIPIERLDTVFQTAIAECRARTKKQIELPARENFRIEYVTDKPWGGYNWYQGNHQSLIQVNTDLPIFIERAVDLAAHEGYPGHHVYNALLESHLVRDLGWMEFTIYPLFSSQSLIAEGTANYGIEVAFPGSEKLDFEKEVLYPLAELNPASAGKYDRVMKLVEQLEYAGNEAARQYLNGSINSDQAAMWLEKYALAAPERAEHRIRFFDRYRSYVINYNYGKDLVKRYIESRGGTSDQPERRWQEFKRLLASPRLPSGLK